MKQKKMPSLGTKEFSRNLIIKRGGLRQAISSKSEKKTANRLTSC